MAGFEAFDREIRLATAGLEAKDISAALASFARQQLTDAISAGASPVYNLYVNGRPANSEYEVEAPGPIVYEFALWEPVITFALDELRSRSPVKSGRFRSSFIVIAQQRVVEDYDAIPARAEVIITNFQPYIRKIEGGLGNQKGKRYQVFDGTKRALARRFGNEGRNTQAAFTFETKWLSISGGVHPGIPYILKGHQRLSAGAKAYGRRKDREAGQPITYPAVVMNTVF